MSPQRVRLIAGNWKMHGTRSEASALAEGIKSGVAGLAGREVLVAPPYTALETVARVLSQLVKGGILERRGRTVRILDMDRLRTLAEPDQDTD